MRTIILGGLSERGRSKLKEFGSEWLVVRMENKVEFSDKPGPWLLVSPIKNVNNIQWIHSKYDQHFIIICK